MKIFKTWGYELAKPVAWRGEFAALEALLAPAEKHPHGRGEIRETDQGRLIQVIPARPHGDRHYWPSVYSIAGKMMDVRNIRPNLRRFVIIENSETIETARAGTLIAECASVIQYSCEGNLRQQLMAS